MRALLPLLLAASAFASQVHFDSAPLQEVLRRADWIVVAERLPQPADARQTRYRVAETIRWRDTTTPAPTGTVLVFGANQELNEAMAKHYAEHGNQGMPSPVVPRYASSLDEARFAKAKKVILFLRPWKKDWQLALEGAWEAVGQKAAIAAAALKK
jgi:hypothetical protein